MGTEAPATTCKKPLPLPPALFLVRSRSRAATGWPTWATPPRRSPVTVPFLWEEAPGKPKAPPPQGDGVPSDAGATATTTPGTDAGGHDNSGGGAEEASRPVPLKLPPRLQRVASAKHDGSLSPKTVLHGPYYYGCTGGGRRPPRRTGSGFAAFRRTPSAGADLFSRSKNTAAAEARTNKNKGGGGGHDHLNAPWCSPASSSSASSSSSSSLSTACFGDEPGHGGHRRTCDVREADGSSEEDDCATAGSVRITRFLRNRSLPSVTTSHLWASIRKSVKQITPWS